MSKELKDYLHLYLGCQFRLRIKSTGELSAQMYFGTDALMAALSKDKDVIIEPLLTLRPLSDMTEEEKEVVLTLKQPITDGVHKVLIPVDTPESVRYLLSKSFDLFGLIEAGLAIDKTKNNTQP